MQAEARQGRQTHSQIFFHSNTERANEKKGQNLARFPLVVDFTKGGSSLPEAGEVANHSAAYQLSGGPGGKVSACTGQVRRGPQHWLAGLRQPSLFPPVSTLSKASDFIEDP